MGKKKKTVRVVLDTNVLVSALLFDGRLSKIVDLWQEGKIVPLITPETFDEFRRVLLYPKFSLTEEEIKVIIEEYVLPFFEVVESAEKVTGVCKDPDDDKFLSCAVSAEADYIVSGDRDLCALEEYRTVKIISADELLKLFKLR